VSPPVRPFSPSVSSASAVPSDQGVEEVSPGPPGLTDRTLLRQHWAELAYFHWRYPSDEVQRLLPRGVTVDTFDGDAWVGLIPFEMRDVRIGRSPVVPWLGSFLEINVRTYVTDQLGRRAVWFFSLDVPRAAIVAVARSAFALPYCWAHTEHHRNGDHHRYRTERRWPRGTAGRADMRFTVGASMAPESVGELEHFLSARWALITRRGGRLMHGRVDHPRWPLHHLSDVEVRGDLIEAAGLPAPAGAPHAMYSPGVDVQVSRFRTVRAAPTPGRPTPP
jgi:uncharacterized protein YqjF (DUF2071 family)